MTNRIVELTSCSSWASAFIVSVLSTFHFTTRAPCEGIFVAEESTSRKRHGCWEAHCCGYFAENKGTSLPELGQQRHTQKWRGVLDATLLESRLQRPQKHMCGVPDAERTGSGTTATSAAATRSPGCDNDQNRDKSNLRNGSVESSMRQRSESRQKRAPHWRCGVLDVAMTGTGT